MGLFSKGIKLPKKADSTTFKLIETPPPKKVILPLKQYIGEPSQPTVKVGDNVKVGQIIATSVSDSSIPVHATISGSVTDITEHLDYMGVPVPSIIIESDGTDTWIEPEGEEKDIESLSPTEILKRINEAGLISKALVPIPLNIDLSPIDQPKTHLYLTGKRVVKKTDTLLINALDPEPSLGVNRYLAGIVNDELPIGIAALKAITGALNTLFVVDKGTPPFPHLNEMVAKDEEEATKIISLDGQRFPVALTVPLLKAALGRELPLPYGHPRDIGVALYDIETTLSIGASVHKQIPQVELPITVGGGLSLKVG